MRRKRKKKKKTKKKKKEKKKKTKKKKKKCDWFTSPVRCLTGLYILPRAAPPPCLFPPSHALLPAPTS